MDNVNNPSTSGGYYCYHHYHYSYNKSKRLFGFGFASHDPKYYDQIITKLNLQAMEQHEISSIQCLLQDQTASSGDKKKKRILLVDDEPDICMIYRIVLEDAGYECIPYTDPVKALQEFRIDYYDLILLDIKMPILDGAELCKKIREADKSIRIIFITASGEFYKKIREESYPELINYNNINYIQKPIGNEELVQIVNTIVGNSITVD